MKKIMKTVLSLLFASFAVFSVGACKSEEQSAPPQDNGIFYRGDWSSELSGNISDYRFLDTAENKLYKDLGDDEETVTYGTLVKLIAPIVIDGKGNCLGVRTKVYLSDGEEVQMVSDGFFAVSPSGYKIVYTIKTLDGKTHNVTKTINVSGADGIYSDGKLTVELTAMFSVKEVILVDLSGKNEYDLIDLLSPAEAKLYDEKYNSGKVVWRLISSTGKTQTLDGRVVDFSETETANYIVTATLEKRNSEEIFYVGVADFYDGDGILAWDSEGGDIERAELSGATGISSLTLSDFAGKSGKYYKMESGINADKTEEFSFRLVPIHSKEYYEKFGAGKKLKFDMYFSAETAIDRNTNEPMAGEKLVYIGTRFSGSRQQFRLNNWSTFTLNLDDYRTEWDSFITIEQTMYTSSTWCYGGSCTGYIGNIRIE